MCFSYGADLVAAAATAPLGVLTLRAARGTREYLLGALPAVFAVHQFVEAFVWLGDDGRVSREVQHAAIVVYLVIAQVLLPLLVPLGATLLEPDRSRRRLMALPLLCGVFTAAWFVVNLTTHPVGAHPTDHAMVYDTDFHIGPWVTITYIVATCGAILLSTRRYLFWFGIANVIGLSLAALVRYEAVTSVWCVYAAFASVLLLVHFRAERRGAAQPGRRPRPSGSSAARG